MNRSTDHLLFAVIGFVIWLIFIVIARTLGPEILKPESTPLLIIYILSIPLLYILIWMVSKLTGVPLNQMLVPLVVITMVIITLDGIVIGFTNIYGETDAQIRATAGPLLYGPGIGLIMALFLGRGENHTI